MERISPFKKVNSFNKNGSTEYQRKDKMRFWRRLALCVQASTRPEWNRNFPRKINHSILSHQQISYIKTLKLLSKQLISTDRYNIAW